MAMLEKDIQRKIMTWLKANGWLAWKQPAGRYGKAGLPDLIAMKNKLVVFLEVKRPGERPTEIQTRVMEEINAHGVLAVVVHSPEETKAVLDCAMAFEILGAPPCHR